MSRPLYEHTQAGWPMRIAFLAAAMVFLVLTVRIEGGELQLRFGLGWPRKTVRLADIATVEITRTTFLEGWGVHRTRRGWLYNVSGFDAVLLRLRNGKTMMVGTDEPRRLKAAIERAQARS